jgi:hypothetical protein
MLRSTSASSPQLHEVHRKVRLERVWISLAILFNVGVYVLGQRPRLEWTTGTSSESLSADNVFTFLLICDLSVPKSGTGIFRASGRW